LLRIDDTHGSVRADVSLSYCILEPEKRAEVLALAERSAETSKASQRASATR